MSFAKYLRSVSVANTTAPVQTRMRSWIDAHCSHCHRRGGFGPGYDGRFYTPLRKQNLVNEYVKFRNLAGSLLYQRDNSLNEFKMPPLGEKCHSRDGDGDNAAVDSKSVRSAVRVSTWGREPSGSALQQPG